MKLNKISSFSLKWHLENLCKAYGGCAMIVTVQGYFQRILGTHKYLGTHEKKNVVKSAESNPAWCICHSSAPIRAANVPKVPFLR